MDEVICKSLIKSSLSNKKIDVPSIAVISKIKYSDNLAFFQKKGREKMIF